MFIVTMTLEYEEGIEADWASGNTPEQARERAEALKEIYEREGATVTLTSGAVRA